MMRRCLVATALLALLLPPAPIRAEDFSIKLQVRAAGDARAVEAIYPVTKPAPRNVLVVAAERSVTVKWTVRNVDKTAIAKDVLVHFVVVKQDKLDQVDVPKLGKNAIVESALTMDFRPQDKSDGEHTFAIPRTGYYLIRLELQGTAAKQKEPFAALDLDVR